MKFLKVQVDIQIPAASLLLICRCVPVNLRRLRVGLLRAMERAHASGAAPLAVAPDSELKHLGPGYMILTQAARGLVELGGSVSVSS